MKNEPVPEMCVQVPCPACGAPAGPVVASGIMLRAYRVGKGKSMTSVAAELGVSKSYLGDIERDYRNASPSFVARFKAAVKRAQGDQRKGKA